MKGIRLFFTSMLLLCSHLMALGQITADAQTDFDMTGAPIVSHGMYYTGMVEYDGEMIPSFLFADVYVFNKLIFKNTRQARKYYKIANNIKKVYPIAVEIQKTVNKTIAQLDSLPTKREKDEFIKQSEKELKKEYYPRLKKLTDKQCFTMSGFLLLSFHKHHSISIILSYKTLYP